MRPSPTSDLFCRKSDVGRNEAEPNIGKTNPCSLFASACLVIKPFWAYLLKTGLGYLWLCKIQSNKFNLNFEWLHWHIIKIHTLDK